MDQLYYDLRLRALFDHTAPPMVKIQLRDEFEEANTLVAGPFPSGAGLSDPSATSSWCSTAGQTSSSTAASIDNSGTENGL